MSGWGQPNNSQGGWGQPTNNQGGWGQPTQNQGQGWGQPTHNQGQGWGNNSQGSNWGHGGNTGTGQVSYFKQHIDYIFTTALDHSLVLDVSGDPKTKGSLLIWKKHLEQNQRFKIKQLNNGKYKIYSKQGHLCLAVGDSSNGSNIQAGFQNNTPNQQWEFHPAKGEKDAFYVRSFCGKAMDVFEQKKSKGTKVIQYDYNGQKNQVWYVSPA